MKKWISIILLVLTSFYVMGETTWNFTEDNLDNSKAWLQVASLDEKTGESSFIVMIGVGDSNKGTLSIMILGNYVVYGTHAVQVMYKLDEGEVYPGFLVCSGNGNILAATGDQLTNFWNGVQHNSYLIIRVIGFNGSIYNYQFNLNEVRNALREAGMNI